MKYYNEDKIKSECVQICKFNYPDAELNYDEINFNEGWIYQGVFRLNNTHLYMMLNDLMSGTPIFITSDYEDQMEKLITY